MWPMCLDTILATKTGERYFINKEKPLTVTEAKMRKFLGACILMGNLKFPRIRMYWESKYRIPSIADALTRTEFLDIYANLSATTDHDKPANPKLFWKVDPIVQIIRENMGAQPMEEFNSIDEQMIPFHGRMPARQYIKNKPNPVGLKSYVRCGKSGIAYDFEFYEGAGTGVNYRHLGLGGSVVKRLCEKIPRHENFKVFFDNHFTGLPLLEELKSDGILALGVIMPNRMGNPGLKTKAELQKEGRESYDHRVEKSGDISLIRWNDNSIVNLASTFVGKFE